MPRVGPAPRRSSRCPGLEAKHAPWCEECTWVCGPTLACSVLRAWGTWELDLPPGPPPLSLPPPHLLQPSALCFTPHCAGDKPEVLKSQTRLLGQETRSNVRPSRAQDVVLGHTPQRSPGSHWPLQTRMRQVVGLPSSQDAEGWGKEAPWKVLARPAATPPPLFLTFQAPPICPSVSACFVSSPLSSEGRESVAQAGVPVGKAAVFLLH